MLRLSTTNRVSTNTSSAFLKYCPVKRYIYTRHNNTIVQLVCMKCEMKWEESGLQSKTNTFREQGIVFLALFTICTQYKSGCLQKSAFLSNLWVLCGFLSHPIMYSKPSLIETVQMNVSTAFGMKLLPTWLHLGCLLFIATEWVFSMLWILDVQPVPSCLQM